MRNGKCLCLYLFRQNYDKYNMDNNLDKVALDLYGKIQTRFPDIKIGDENAEVLSKKSDIPRARFFEFEYKEDGEPLGTITITLDDTDGVIVQVSGDIANSSKPDHRAYKFIRSFRQFAKNRLLNFDVQDIGKSNLDKRDYQFQSKPKELPMMESKMYGTSRISYQDLGEARLIVKHTQPVNTELAAGRTMHIESIYIESIEGERFKYPYKHLHGARALAEHIKHGGNPYDSIGKHITGLSEELNQLRKFKGYVSRQPMISEAMGTITNKVIERIEELKKEIHNLQRPAFYEQFAETFKEKDDVIIPEDIMNDWIDRLTVRTFNEELKSVFPYLYNIVDESEIPVCELDSSDLLDDYIPSVKEEAVEESFNYSPEDELESFFNNVIKEDKDELFSTFPNAKNRAINDLNTLLASGLTGGESGVLALKGIIDDPEFIDELRVLTNPAEINERLKNYILDRDADLMNSLKFPEETAEIGGANMPPPAAPPAAPPTPEVPAAEPAAPPAAPMAPPMAESSDRTSRLKAKFIKAKAAGATLETQFSEGMTLLDAMKECGINPMECGFAEEQSGVREIENSISGFWNPEEENFTIGGTRAKTKIIKGMKDGEFPHASVEDAKHVINKIEQLDPSKSQEQDDIITLAGIHSPVDDRANKLDIMMKEINAVNEESDILGQLKKNAGI